MANKFDEFLEYDAYLELKNSTCNYLHRRREVTKELEGLDETGVILDIGSGISPMAEIKDNVILGDMSLPSMKLMKGKGANCAVLDITHLGIKSNSIDIIICSEVLEHIADDIAALREMNRVLKKGGSLIITVPTNKHYWLRDDELVGHVRRYDTKELTKIIEGAGFDVVKIRGIGSLTERLTTYLITTIFLSTRIIPINRKSSNPKRLIRIYRALNIIWSHVIFLSSRLTIPYLSSLTLITCKKQDGA